MTFLNNYDNQDTGLGIHGNCDEALYVHTLVLGADTHVTVDNCMVYYGEIINYGAEIEFVGCGDMTEIVLPADPENAQRPNPCVYTEYGGICNDDSDCWGPAPPVAYCVLAAEADPSGLNMCYAPANRYISIARREDQVAHTARRITLQGGGAGPWWVGEPSYSAAEDMYFASVVDEPVYSGVGGGEWVDNDWPEVVHVKGCEIAPDATYLVQAIQNGQDIGEESNYSETLELRTAPLWGDIVSSCAFDHCLPPEGEFGQPSIDDVLAEVNAFQGIRNAPLWWMDIDPVYADGEPEGLWTLIGDVLAVVNAFSGGPYPGWGPTGCP